MKSLFHLTLVSICLTCFFSCKEDEESKPQNNQHPDPENYNPADDFVTTWQTNPDEPDLDLSLATDDNSITIPTNSQYGDYNFDVDWDNDGKFDDYGLTKTTTHRYKQPGIYTVRIRGTFPAIHFDKDYTAPGQSAPATDNHKLLSIDQWGNQSWKHLLFYYCVNFNITATDLPDLSQVTDMKDMFGNCWAFNSDIGNWDVSHITNMKYMFFFAKAFNQDIGSWDVSNVTNMQGMFYTATKFNQYIGGWDVSNVKDMGVMFSLANSFNHDIGDWNVGKVENMLEMFGQAYSFNQDISNWNVSQVEDMEGMFRLTNSFNEQNYDKLLIAWSQQNLQPSVKLSGTVQYCSNEAAAAREKLINDFDWAIEDGGSDCD